MYNQSYEDYMRNVLGYNPMPDNNCMPCDTYDNYRMFNPMMMSAPTQMPMQNTDEIEQLYPDIYRIINPMVCKICSENTRPICREVVEEMTDTIYRQVESTEITVTKAVKVESRNGDVKNPNAKDDMQETRQQNFLLRDLITILILNQILRGERPHHRPPMPGPRPPMPGPGPRPPRPPFPGMPRPPMPRDYFYM